MRISTRGRYGVRAMVSLAGRWNEGPVMLKTIAAEEHLSANYLEQLFTQLKNAGLIRVQRGNKGGFSLSRPPSEIRLSEVLLALEGGFDLVDCVTDGENCGHSADCVTRDLWAEMADAIRTKLDSVTLDALVRRSA